MIISDNERWTVIGQDTVDGSGDIIVDLPPDLLAKLGLGLGDELAIEVIGGVIDLKPKRDPSFSPLTLCCHSSAPLRLPARSARYDQRCSTHICLLHQAEGA